jgi:hypothetical protein
VCEAARLREQFPRGSRSARAILRRSRFRRWIFSVFFIFFFFFLSPTRRSQLTMREKYRGSWNRAADDWKYPTVELPSATVQPYHISVDQSKNYVNNNDDNNNNTDIFIWILEYEPWTGVYYYRRPHHLWIVIPIGLLSSHRGDRLFDESVEERSQGRGGHMCTRVILL